MSRVGPRPYSDEWRERHGLRLTPKSVWNPPVYRKSPWYTFLLHSPWDLLSDFHYVMPRLHSVGTPVQLCRPPPRRFQEANRSNSDFRSFWTRSHSDLKMNTRVLRFRTRTNPIFCGGSYILLGYVWFYLEYPLYFNLKFEGNNLIPFLVEMLQFFFFFTSVPT